MKNLTIVMTIMVMVLASVGTAEAVNYPSYKPNYRSGAQYESMTSAYHSSGSAYRQSSVSYQSGRYVSSNGSSRNTNSSSGSRIPAYRRPMNMAVGVAGTGLPGEDGLGENGSYGMSGGPRRILSNGDGEFEGEFNNEGQQWDGEDWVAIATGTTRNNNGVIEEWNGSAWVPVSHQADPSAPIGATPWLLMLLLAGGYAALAARRRKA